VDGVDGAATAEERPSVASCVFRNKSCMQYFQKEEEIKINKRRVQLNIQISTCIMLP
jgi:hypothetical protein